MKLTVFIAVLFFVTASAISGGEIHGTVLDGSSGEALSNVAIQIVGTGYQTISDAGGHFHITAVPAGRYVLSLATVGYWPAKSNFHLDSGETKDFTVVLNPETLRRDTVSVPADYNLVQDAPTVLTLSGNNVKNLSSVLVDDPLRAVQALPGVSSNDDFEARFSLRGADFTRIGVYLDGILLQEPFHTIQTTGGSGSITAINTDLIGELDLYEGAYPVRFGDRSAGALDIHMRDGNQSRYSFRASASFATTSAMAEGPLGKFNRCSWIAGFRKNYLQYLLAHTNDPSLAFGITDGEGRLSCSITPKNNVNLDVIDSYTDLNRSSVEQKLGINSLALANYHFTFADLAWRYTPNDKLLISNHAAWMREKFDDRNPSQNPLGAGSYNEWVGASTLTWVWSSHNPLSAGINVRDMRDFGYAHEYNAPTDTRRVLEVYSGTGTLAGAFVQQSWSLWSNRFQLNAGGRWDRNSIDNVTTFSSQTSVTLSPWTSTHFQLGWGQYTQFPEISQFTSNLGSPSLLPMRATQVIGAVEQRLGERARIRAEFYDRQDRDLLYQPFYDPRLVDGQVFIPPPNPLWENSVRGYARGIEITLQRMSAKRLNGWISYAYGQTRLHDGATNVSFPSDWDQTHTINAYGSYRVRPTVNLSLRWTYGSGFPIPGFLQKERSLYFLSSQRNELRLSAYQRLDLRINKSWTHVNWRTTLYGEILNLTDKTNYRFDSFNGYNPRSGQAFITVDKLFPILPSVGIMVER